MLRKLIVFAITSGLAKKAYDHFKASRAASLPGQQVPRSATHRRATTVNAQDV